MLRFDLQLLRLQPLVVIVVALRLGESAPIKFDDAGGQTIDEGAVMAHEQQRARIFEQKLFEPFDGCNIQVIGRLVEQQHLGLRHQRARQQHASPPATGELIESGRRVQVQARGHVCDPLLELPAIAGVELMMQFVQPSALRDRVHPLRGERVILGQRPTLLRQPSGHDLRCGLMRHGGDVLRQMGDAGTGSQPQCTGIRLGFAQQQPQQRGFALAIAADQRQALTFLQRQRYTIQQRA
jgi:hypothetical protein